MINKDKIRTMLFAFPPMRELLFFAFGKKVYKRSVDKKIAALINGKQMLSNKKVDNLIVSMTSFPERIGEIKYAIYSLVCQTLRPQKIVLWLAECQFQNKFEDLPSDLSALEKYGLEIKWCDDLRSYKKLVPSLVHFPDCFIATADDDIYYDKTWLEKLWKTHLEHPDHVVCHVAKVVEFDASGKIIPFVKWKRNIKDNHPRFLNVQLGAGGVLYHKKYLHNDVCKKELFQKLAPFADDIWFYFMSILNKTPICVAKNSCDNVKYVNPYREYGFEKGYTLLEDNVAGGGNDRQFKNVLDYYNIDLRSFTNKARG